MAAGEGRRMGSVPKSLIARDGEALLLRQIRLLTEAGIHTIAVVLGYYAMRLTAVLEKARWSQTDSPVARAHLKVVINPDPDEGPASSLRCGLKALPPELSAILVVLGDQPLLEGQDFAAVLAAWRGRAKEIELAVPRRGDRLGHPIVFGPAVRAAVLAGQGVRGWREQHPEGVRFVDATHDRFTVDLDTPDDVRAACVTYGANLVLPEIK
ncbi:MAG: nucleotidyltransferase family protein [Burkholderiaceae bacterium]|jgi:molybdenum cofactor cytidylyltransferase/nicotine blue oxidoreductase|nr:MAG: nucleotidyltransferase family protein [Burkholderiaceae bacterium]